MEPGRVTVVCLCYNHEAFVEDSIRSVMNQTYKNTEIIAVDDASTDRSKAIIGKLAYSYPQIQFISLEKNIGNCAAFNKALAVATGEYIIDHASDDILLPERIEKGIASLVQTGAGVNFCNAINIDEKGAELGHHYQIDQQGKATVNVPEGDVYKELVQRYFICPPTMMVGKQVFDALGGYDEALAYEDFDFWVRSSRVFAYCYTDEVLVKRRILSVSKSVKQYSYKDAQMRSTYRVCEKIRTMNRSAPEQNALKKRIAYEWRMCLRTGNLKLAWNYARLYSRIS